MADVLIRVGAASDRASYARAFEGMVAAAERAQAVVRAGFARTAAAAAQSGKQAGDGFARAAAQGQAAALAGINRLEAAQRSSAEREVRAFERAAQAKVRADQRAFDERMRMADREAKAVERAMDREMRALSRRDAQELKNLNRRIDRTGGAIVQGAYGTLSGVASRAYGAGRQVFAGMGVNTSMASLVANAAEAEKLSVRLSNSAYQAGEKGPAGVRQDPKELLAFAREVAKANAVSTVGVLEGMSAFVGKTGNLDLARQSMAELAKLARATGSEMDDMVGAAASVSLALGDADKNGQVMLQVMRGFAAQGKLGAGEIRDLVNDMAKISANAPQFEGGTAKNMATMGAMVQFALRLGGAATAKEGLQHVASYTQTMKTPQTIANWQKYMGQSVFTKEGMIRDPFVLMRAAIEKYASDPGTLQKLFPNVRGARGVTALANMYRQAGGGEKGLAAVDSEFKRMQSATLGKAEIDESHRAALNTTEAKAQQFNTRMEEAAQKIQAALLPALESAIPHIEAFGTALGRAVGWAAENPAQAITLAIVAAIGKAAVAQAVSGAMANFLSTVAGGAAVGGARGALGAAAGKLGTAGAATLAVGALAIAAYQGVQLYGEIKGGGFDTMWAKLKNDLGITTKAEYRKELGMSDTGSGAELANKGGSRGRWLEISEKMNGVKGTSEPAKVKLEAESMAPVVAAVSDMSSKLGGTLDVHVDNMPGDDSGPGVNPFGRRGTGGVE